MLEKGRIMESLISVGSTPGGMNKKGFSEGGREGVRVLEAGIEECRRVRKEGVVVVVVVGMEREEV
jgi:hypothetical protein